MDDTNKSWELHQEVTHHHEGDWDEVSSDYDHERYKESAVSCPLPSWSPPKTSPSVYNLMLLLSGIYISVGHQNDLVCKVSFAQTVLKGFVCHCEEIYDHSGQCKT